MPSNANARSLPYSIDSDAQWADRVRTHGDIPPAMNPSWYQGMYTYAAACLNEAFAGWAITKYLIDPDRDEHRQLIEVDLAPILRDTSAPPDGITALRHAAHVTRVLIATMLETLDKMGTSTSKRPRFVITTGRRQSLRNNRIRTFLQDQVHDASLTILAGVLQLRDAIYVRTPNDDASIRKAKMLDDRALYLELGTVNGPDHRAIVTTLEARDALDYRVLYNLACYYAQMDSHEGEALGVALRLLSKAIREAPGGIHDLMRDNAKSDPELAALRTQRRGEFLAIVRDDPSPGPRDAQAKPPNAADGIEPVASSTKQLRRDQLDGLPRAIATFELFWPHLAWTQLSSALDFIGDLMQARHGAIISHDAVLDAVRRTLPNGDAKTQDGVFATLCDLLTIPQHSPGAQSSVPLGDV